MFTIFGKIVKVAKVAGSFIMKHGKALVSGIAKIATKVINVVKTSSPTVVEAASKVAVTVKNTVTKVAPNAGKVFGKIKKMSAMDMLKAIVTVVEGITIINILLLPFKHIKDKFVLNRKLKKAAKKAKKEKDQKKSELSVSEFMDENGLEVDDILLKPHLQEKQDRINKLKEMYLTLPENTKLDASGDVIDNTDYHFTICGPNRAPVEIADGVFIDHRYRRFREVATGEKISNLPDFNADGRFDHMTQEEYEDHQIASYISMGLLPKNFVKEDYLSPKKAPAFFHMTTRLKNAKLPKKKKGKNGLKSKKKGKRI